MWHGHAHIAGTHLFIRKDFINGLDRPTGNPRGTNFLQPAVYRVRAKHLLEKGNKGCPVLHAGRVGGKPFVSRQLGAGNKPAEFLPLSIVANRQTKIAVLGLKGLIRHNRRMGVAIATRLGAGHQIITAYVGQPGNLSVQQRNVDCLALARFRASQQGGLNGISGKQTRSDIGNGNPDFHRLALGLARNAHHPAPALNNEIVAGQVLVRSGLAVAGNRAIDQPGILLFEMFIAQPQPCHFPGFEVLNQHITDANQTPDQLFAGIRLEIDGDAFFIAVGTQVIRAFPAGKRRPPGPGIIPAARPFDLDDLGPKVSQSHGAERPGQDAREIKDPKTVQRLHHTHSLTPFRFSLSTAG